MSRKEFLQKLGLSGASLFLLRPARLPSLNLPVLPAEGVTVDTPERGEDIFSYIRRKKGSMDQQLYQQLVGAANAFKEGDLTIGVAAADEASRANARSLLAHTTLRDLEAHSLFEDDLYRLIRQTTKSDSNRPVHTWTMGQLKKFILTKPEAEIKAIMPLLSSDAIGCLVKLMSNEELIRVGQKVFNPLPGSQIGSKGYLSARVQPNSPTDNVDDIVWQVFDAWSYTVGDLVLGTNPVSSEPASVAKIEQALHDLVVTFELEDTLPNCVLSHIDIQAEVEGFQPGTTGIWFQSLGGTVAANKTFDVTIQKMFDHAAQRNGKYGFYAETGQGADFTNGHGEGFDMVIHEARKYGFIRALKQAMAAGKSTKEIPWVHVNDVAGFIGPEVFKSREQLVRCCLEDTAMGKLHGLPIGLDICSTLHMDISLDDLDWCIEQIMPANPAYLMALPTKNDPMLSYLTTAFHNHLEIRERLGYKINDAMWAFFKRLQVIDEDGRPTTHFGDPIWVYYQYRLAKGDDRTKADIYKEGRQRIREIRDRGVPIAEGYGEHIWELSPGLDREVQRLYEDAKVSIWTEMTDAFARSIPAVIPIVTTSTDRKDYVYHPESGEQLSETAVASLKNLRRKWGKTPPDIQLVISDGLNARALMDEGHLMPYLEGLRGSLSDLGYTVAEAHLLITYGRVRAGYKCGEVLFGQPGAAIQNRGIVHIIGERPGSGHHNFSAYLTVTSTGIWHQKGTVDHDITRVVSGISDTAFPPAQAVRDTVRIVDGLFAKG
jgi:ethanolamine ammonia-lyase large subunit